MMIQNKILTGIILASALLVVGCSDDESTSEVTGYTPPDYSSLLDQLNSDPPEVGAVKEKYGECDSKQDGLVVNGANTSRYKVVCKDSSWQIVDEYSFDEDIAWYYYGSCTDKEEGEIRLPIYNNSYLEKSHICKNHSWKEIQKSTLPTCNKDHLGQVIYLGSNNAVICDEKKKWRDASIIEASWLINSSLDTVAGLCYKERDGERIRLVSDEISSGLYYKCANNVWTHSNAAEYTYGECKGAFLDSIVQLSDLEKYICQDTGWHRFNLIELGLGICNAEQQNVMSSSPYVIGPNTNVCDNGKWRDATDIERAGGVCTEEIKGKTDSIHTPAEFYTCDKYWRIATDDEILHARLGECDIWGAMNKVDTILYACDTDGWRTADSIEQHIGFCDMYDRTGTIKTEEDTITYICTKNGWKVANPAEIFIGLCIEERYGTDIITEEKIRYLCEETGWRIGDETEQIIGFCNSEIEDQVRLTYLDGNPSTYFACHENKWQEATEEEILYSELGACPQYNLNVSNNYNGQKYLCEESGWRLGNELEQAIGFCTSRTENQIDTFEETMYICNGSEWIVFVPEE